MTDEFFEWMTEKGGPESGNHGHAGIPGHLGGSAPSISDEEITSMAKHVIETGGFTYNTYEGEIQKEGKMVSPYPEHGTIVDKEKLVTGYDEEKQKITVNISVIEDSIKAYIKKNMKYIKANPENRLGGWLDVDNREGDASGNFFIDISIDAKTHENAVQLCKDHEQIAYYDIKTKETIVVNPNAKGAKEKKMGKTKQSNKPVKYLFEPGIPSDEAIHKAAVLIGNKWEEWANKNQDKFDLSKMKILSKEEIAEAEAKKK